MGKWRMVKLGDIFERQITGEWGSECSEGEDGVNVLRTTNFTNKGNVDYQNVIKRKIEADCKMKMDS